jgi:enoyl-CoA hydratase/carnithine racemase
LINRIYPDHDSLLEGVMAVAREIATKAPLAVSGCKRVINFARDHNTRDGLDYVGIWNASMLQFDEIREAIAANKEQREARFAELPARSGKREG